MAGNKQNLKLGSAWVAYMRQGGPWRWLGYSQDGVGLNYSTEVTDINVDQETIPVMTNVTSETFEVSFPAVEMTQENIALAFPGARIRGGSVDIYPASSVNQATVNGLLLIHPTFGGKPLTDQVDFSQPGYDPAHDILLYAAPTSSMEISMTREDLQKLNLTFKGTPDPLGRLLVWGDPMRNSPITFAPLDLTGDVDDVITDTLAATGGTAPYQYLMSPMPGFSLAADELSFTSATAGTFRNLVFVRDGAGNIAQALVTVTVA
jgi:hypothetical protein